MYRIPENLSTNPSKQSSHIKKKGLVPDDQPGDSRLAASLVFRESDHWDFDVRIHVQIIGITVVFIMLFDPPAAVDADQEAHEQTENIVIPARSEHLVVAQIVPSVAYLHDDER